MIHPRELPDRGGFGKCTRIAFTILACCGTSLVPLPASAVEPAADIRVYNHQGIQTLIALDVLRASTIVNGQATLVVGRKYFAANAKSRTRLAVLAHDYLRGRNLQFDTLVLVDGRTGRAFATYDPAQGLLRPR